MTLLSTTMRNLRKVTHVIFDMDGVIIDSEKTYAKVIDAIVKKYGKSYTDDVRMKVLGTPEQMTAKILIEEMQLPLSSEQFLKVFHEKCYEALQHPPLIDGVDTLVRHLHKNNIPIAIATSSTAESTEVKTQDHKPLFSLFSHKVMGGTDPEVKRGKPNPDIFLVCASRFPDKPSPDKCLVFEDSPNGVKGARSAGMQVVMLPDEILEESLCKDATLVIKSFRDFQPELFGLPPIKQ